MLLHLFVGFDVRVVEVRLEHDDTVRQHIRRVGGGEHASVVDAEAFGELFHNAIDLLGFPWDPESTDARDGEGDGEGDVITYVSTRIHTPYTTLYTALYILITSLTVAL